MKKIVSILFVMMLLAACVLPLTVSAAETTEPGYIYFIAPAEGDIVWKNFSTVYCHMWSKTGGDIYGWQEKAERCEDMENGYWRYDVSGISFDPEGEYSLIFSNENGMQTYNLNITSSCLGDIVYCDGTTCVNPVDGEKTCAVARWMNNGDTVHPAIEVDSTGVTLNVDGVDPADAETVWGTGEGSAYEMAELTVPEEDADDENAADDVDEDDTLLIAPAPDGADTNQDGLDTGKATMWIIIGCAAAACVIAAVVIVLAKKNKK